MIKKIILLGVGFGSILALSIGSAPVTNAFMDDRSKEDSYVKPFKTYPHIYHDPESSLLLDNRDEFPKLLEKESDESVAKVFKTAKRDRPPAPKGAKYLKMTISEDGQTFETTNNKITGGVWKRKGDPAKEILIPYLENDTAYSVAKRYCEHSGYGTPKKSYDAVTFLNWYVDKKDEQLYGKAKYAVIAWDRWGITPIADEASCKMNDTRFN